MIVTWLLALAIAQDANQSPRSRPIELLQAKSCEAGGTNSASAVADLPNDRMVSLEAIPPCLADVMKRLQAKTSKLVGNPDATSVLQISVGRAFSETGLMFSAPDDPQIHYVEDVSSLTDILSSEWADYVSPDGELGFSGFVMVVDKEGAKVRLSTSPEPLMGAYETSLQLEAEFYPNKKPDVPADVSETHR